MTIDLTSYRSIGNLTDWLVRFSIVMILLSIISMAADFYVTLSGGFDDSQISITDIIGTFVSIISFLIILILLIWYYRATKNIHSFGAKEVTSPRMAVIWWFIPIADLWKPYKIAQQIWKASNPEIKLTNGTEWKNSPSSKIIKIWWVLLLISGFGALTAGFIVGLVVALTYHIDSDVEVESFSESVQTTLLVNIVRIPILIISIISTIYFIRMIRQISTWQYQKSIGFV